MVGSGGAVPGHLYGLEWSLLATVGPVVIGLLLIIWLLRKG